MGKLACLQSLMETWQLSHGQWAAVHHFRKHILVQKHGVYLNLLMFSFKLPVTMTSLITVTLQPLRRPSWDCATLTWTDVTVSNSSTLPAVSVCWHVSIVSRSLRGGEGKIQITVRQLRRATHACCRQQWHELGQWLDGTTRRSSKFAAKTETTVLFYWFFLKCIQNSIS